MNDEDLIKCFDEVRELLDSQEIPKPWYACVHFNVLHKLGWTDEQIEKYRKDHADIQRGSDGGFLTVMVS